MKYYLFRTKNFIARLITLDKYYQCDCCGKMHKRDGSELKLGESIFDKSISIECYYETINGFQNIVSKSLK